MKTKKDSNYKSIVVGDIKEGNSEVLKKLFWIIPNSRPSREIQVLIDDCDIRIKHPRFNDLGDRI